MTVTANASLVLSVIALTLSIIAITVTVTNMIKRDKERKK